jgi:hypothetical protein
MKVLNLTLGTCVKTIAGQIRAIVINSHTNGSLAVYDGLTVGSGKVLFKSMTLGASERYIPFYDTDFSVGLYVDKGGTINYSVIYR